MLSEKFFGRKNAGITFEVTLSIALLIIVLFLTLGLFSDNLQTMAANGGMQKLFDKEKSVEKTVYLPKVVNATQTQVNVQVVAEQGLDWYLTQAQDAIKMYKQTPPKTETEFEDLAKAATIAKILGVLDGKDEGSFYNDYGIDIDMTNSKTFIKSKFIKYSGKDSLTAVKLIKNSSFN